jgi:Flp pilus assembly pilin Flp
VNFFATAGQTTRDQDIAEYAVMLAVILVLVVGTIRLVGTQANNVFSETASTSVDKLLQREKEQLLEETRYRLWTAVLREVKKGISEWNRQFLPSDGSRIVLDEIQDRVLTLTSRTAVVTATISLDGREIALVGRQNSDVAHRWQDFFQVDVNRSRHFELRRGGSNSSPGELAYLLVERAKSSRACRTDFVKD